jgi:hypothetical protein
MAAAALGGLAALPVVAVALLLGAGALAIVASRRPTSEPAPEALAPAPLVDPATSWVRAALVEQLDNCRAWSSADPARGEPSVRNLHGAEPRLAAIGTMVDHVDLPPDLAAYLIWLTSTVGDQWGRIEVLLEQLADSWTRGPDPAREGQLMDDWRAMVERLQVTAALPAAAARRRGRADVAKLHDIVAWTVVPRRPDRWRELLAISDRMRGIPPFPADPAFVSVTPEARDLVGAATGARQERELSDAMHAGVDRVLHRH